MTEQRVFPLADLLSLTTDRLLSRTHMDGIYSLVNYMTGQDVYTHQLPVVGEACGKALLVQHPFLAGLQPPADADVPGLLAWLAAAERVHGDSHPVQPLTDWVPRNPIEDAADIFGAENVYVAPVHEG
jgi:hypothetical protein